jgi:hypothetical protein
MISKKLQTRIQSLKQQRDRATEQELLRQQQEIATSELGIDNNKNLQV